MLSLTLSTCSIAFVKSYYNKRKTMPFLYFILKHFDPWSKVYTYNFRTRNHCRLIEWIIDMDYSLYSYSSKRSIICTLDLKHWSPNLFWYFRNNGHLSIMIIYLSRNCKISQNPHLYKMDMFMMDTLGSDLVFSASGHDHAMIKHDLINITCFLMVWQTIRYAGYRCSEKDVCYKLG